MNTQFIDGCRKRAGSSLNHSNPMIEISDLSKTYSTRDGTDIHALRDINVSINHGQLVTLVGPSGCGKSTLLRILGGIARKSSGEVRLRGTSVDGPSRQVGMVFQSPVLLPWRTILQNTLLPSQLHGDGMARRPIAKENLRLVGLEGFEERYPAELSGGMQQRVSIARALTHDPDLLLMDEPFGALDAMTRESMNLDLLKIKERSGKTVILVTHSIPEAVFLADRVVVMSPRPGRIVEVIDVELPKPRVLEMVNSKEFGSIVARIRAHFNSLGTLDA
jgi:NitT/TauT family transport system ATP-binding protein